MNKLSKTAKILSILLNILCWVVLLTNFYYGIITALGAFNILRADMTGSTFISGITVDYLKIYSATGGITVDSRSVLNMSILSLIVYFGEIPLMCYGIQLLRKVLRPMEQQRPFSGTGKLLKRLGWVSLGVALIENVTDYWMHHIMEYHYRLAELFQGSKITDITFLFQVDYTFLLAAAVFFILSGVFQYGEELQQLSDETL